MGFFGFLGNALRKVGDFGATAISKLGSIGVPAYRAVNHITGGALGNAIESIPGVGPVAKIIGQKLGDSSFLNSVGNGFRGLGGLGSRIADTEND